MRQALQLFFSRPEGKNLDLGVTRLTGDRERERERECARGKKLRAFLLLRISRAKGSVKTGNIVMGCALGRLAMRKNYTC